MQTAIFYLIGPRSSGKSSLLTFFKDDTSILCIDLDTYIEERVGKSIAEFVDEKGWEAFRLAEWDALHAVVEDQDTRIRLVATGGGIVLREENRAFMKETGISIYLNVPKDLLLERYLADPKHSQRPALTNLTVEEETAQVLAERVPLYRAVAATEIDGTGTLEESARQLRTILQEFLQRTPRN